MAALQAFLPGDISGNGIVDLEDAILALQVSAGITPTAPVSASYTVGGDGRIGLADAVYGLQAEAGLEGR